MSAHDRTPAPRRPRRPVAWASPASAPTPPAPPAGERRTFFAAALGLLAGAAALAGSPRRARAAQMAAQPYIGEIMLVAGWYAPSGWALCNGQLLPINSYDALFTLIGTTYGGDGESTFALPDLRGSVALHFGTGPGLTNRSLGERSGEETTTLFSHTLPAHAHPALAAGASGTSAGPGGLVPARNAAGALHYGPGAETTLDPAAIAPQGGTQPHPNMQPSLALNFCIALNGIWPSPS